MAEREPSSISGDNGQEGNGWTKTDTVLVVSIVVAAVVGKFFPVVGGVAVAVGTSTLVVRCASAVSRRVRHRG